MSVIIGIINRSKVQPNLEKYNATLNTSPIVGLAGRAIRYLNKTSTGSGTGVITESWAHFDNLPSEADTTKGVVHMFPYYGSFYLSVGKNLWKKEARPMSDSKRSEAKNNWPKLFLDGWKKVGSQCMPAEDLVSVAAHAAGATADAVPRFSLFSVDKDGKMKVFRGNDLADNMSFSDVTVKLNKKPIDVKWKKICYYAGKLFGIDAESYSWNINVDTNDATKVEVKDKTLQASTDSLTSNEEGLIALRDKKIYRQRISQALDDEARVKEDTSWSHVIDSPDITYVGVASPGSMLDLHSLTHQLRDQYLKTQIDVMPMVTAIRRSSKQHLALLNLMEADAKDYEKTDDEDAKTKIRQRAVERGVKGALKIATTINKASVNASNAIVNMGVALRGISQELTALQKRMESELETLRETLKKQQGALKKVRDVQFWSLVVVLICKYAFERNRLTSPCCLLLQFRLTYISAAVLLILTLGVAAPAIVVGLGILFATAFIVTKIYESKESDMMSDIAKTEASISSLKSSVDDIKKITPKFRELEIQYKALNMFWGRMTLNSGDLVAWTHDLSTELYESMFDTLTIESAKGSTKDLESGSQMYLDMLTAQGIYLPETNSDISGFSIAFDAPVSSEDAFQAVLEAVDEPFGNGLETDQQEVTVVSSLPQSASSKEFSVSSGAAKTPGTDNLVPVEQNYYVPSRVQLLTEQACVMQSDQAVMALERGDFDAFEAHMDVSTRLFDAPPTLKADTLMKSGKWFDIDIIKQGVTIWLNAGLKDLLAYSNTTLFLDGVGTINSGALLTGAKFISAAVVMDTIKLAKIMQDWAQGANKNLSDEQKLAQAKPYIDSATGLCSNLATITAKLNNGFNTINHAVTDARNKVITDLKMQEALIRSTNGMYWEKISGIQDDIPVIAQIFWSQSKLMAEIMNQANSIEEARREAVRPLEDKRITLEKLRDSGYIYQNQHVTWTDLVQKLSVQFGRVFMTLKDIQSGIKEDVVFNSDVILSIQWPELKSNAEQVLKLLNVNTTLDLTSLVKNATLSQWTSAITSQTFFSLEAPDTEDLDSLQTASFGGTVEDPMQFALQVHPVLETLLANGADETRQFFDDVKAIMVLPHVQTLKAYENTIGSFSLHTEMAETISMYVRSFALIVKALNRIKALSSVQSSRLKKLENKGIEWKTFYKGTQQAIIDASRYVGTANDGLEKSYEELQSLFKKIKANRDVYETRMKPIDDLIAAKRKEVDDYIFQLGADAAAVLFVGAAAGLAVVSGPAVAFKAASAVYQAATKVDGFVTLNTFKTFYSKLNWDEFKESITNLRILRESLKTAVTSLDQLLSCFADTLKYGKDLQTHLRESQQRLTDFETVRLSRTAAAEKRGQDGSSVIAECLKDVDFEDVVKGWDAVGDRCDSWNDMFNAQGYGLLTEF